MLDIRKDELRRVVPITTAYALVLASLYVLKPARNALFLDSQGISALPYVLLIVAVVGGFTAAVYARFTQSLRTDRLIFRTYVVLIAMLLGFRVLLPYRWSWIFYAFYVWVALYGLLTTSLIWLFANAVFTSREARRVFGFIGTGGIAGAILGGLFTGEMVSIVGTDNLLLVCAGLLVVCLGLIRLTPQNEQPPRKQKNDEAEGLSAIFSSPLLRLLAITAGLIAVVTVVVDIQFNEIVDRSFSSKDEKTAFFGQFFAYLSGFSFVFQLLFTSWLLRTRGVGTAILILPVAMGLGSAAIFTAPMLLSGILAKGADGGFRHSVHKAASEALFLPVPHRLKKQAKLFLDTTVDTTASGLGAMLVLLLTGPLGLDYRYLSLISIALTIVIFVFARRMQKAHVDAFRSALEGQKIDLEELKSNLAEAGALSALLPYLKSENVRQVVYVLELLTSVRSKQLHEPLIELLKHPAAQVRVCALKVLQHQNERSLAEHVEPLVNDSDDQVRLEACYLLCMLEDEAGNQSRLSSYLQSEDISLQTAALGCIGRLNNPVLHALITEQLVEQTLKKESPELLRANLAGAISGSTNPSIRRFLLVFTEDPSPIVVQYAIEGLGRSRDKASLPWLLSSLPHRGHRAAARRALAAYGVEALAPLKQAMDDEMLDLRARRNIPRVLGEIGAQGAVDILMAHLYTPDPVTRRNTVRALSKLRANHASLHFDKAQVLKAVKDETQAYFAYAQILELLVSASQAHSAESPTRLLERALVEKRANSLIRIFSLLGLRSSPKDLTNAHHGISSDKPRLQANALEFLDHILPKEIKALLLPLLEPQPRDTMIARSQALFTTHFEDLAQGLEFLLQGRDAWLRACAVFCLPSVPQGAKSALLDSAREDPDPIVRETVELADRASTA